MKHDFIDRYSRLDSPIHRISPGFKLGIAILVVAGWILVPRSLMEPVAMVLFPLFVLAIWKSQIPVLFILKRMMVIVPFLSLIILINFFVGNLGLDELVLMSMRAFFSILVMIILVSTTRFDHLLETLRKWRIPRVFLLILSFMYRYVFILTDEMEKMVRAVRLRQGSTSWIPMLKVYSQVLGFLFIKSYDRAERVYFSMVLRGFDGDQLK